MVKIVTDTCSGISPQLAQRFDITVVPLYVHFVKGFKHIEALVIEDATTPDALEALAERLKSLVPPEHFYRSKVSPVIGTHVGPHVLALSVLEAE